MALAAFAALAQIGISAYTGAEQAYADQQAQGIAKNQEMGMQDAQQQQTIQATQSNAYDEQWMQLKTLSTQLQGDKLQPPQTLLK